MKKWVALSLMPWKGVIDKTSFRFLEIKREEKGATAMVRGVT